MLEGWIDVVYLKKYVQNNNCYQIPQESPTIERCGMVISLASIKYDIV